MLLTVPVVAARHDDLHIAKGYLVDQVMQYQEEQLLDNDRNLE